MANPCFKKSDQSSEYVWTTNPIRMGSDKANYAATVRESRAAIEHSRHRIMYARLVLQTRGIWIFQWRNITESQLLSYQTFYEQAFFLFYPDSVGGTYFQVYIPQNGFQISHKRGGYYDLTIELRQYTAVVCSSSSSSSSSSSLSSSSSSSSSSSLSSSSSSSISVSSSSSSTSSSSSSTSFSSSSSSLSATPEGDLYSYEDTNDDIYRHSGFSATILATFPAPATSGWGLGYDGGGNLLSCDHITDKIYIHSGLSQTISDSGTSPGSAPRSPVSVSKDSSGNLLSLDGTKDVIYIHSGTAFDVETASFTSPDSTPRGITWDGANIISTGTATDDVYVHSGKTDTILSTFQAPNEGGSEEPRGLAWTGFDLIIATETRAYKMSGKTSTVKASFAFPVATAKDVADTSGSDSR